MSRTKTVVALAATASLIGLFLVSTADIGNAEKLNPLGSRGDSAAVRKLLRQKRTATPNLANDKIETRTFDAAILNQDAPATAPSLDAVVRDAMGGERVVAAPPALVEQAKANAGKPRTIGGISKSANRTIIGNDDRVRITKTGQYPFRVFGYIRSQYQNVYGGCSGTLISPRHVLTAAHWVYSEEQGGWPSTVTFFPGRDGNTAPFGGFEAETWTIPTDYKNAGSGYTSKHTYADVAVIKLAEPIGDKLGYLPIADGTSLEFDDNIVGYPGDKESSTMWRVSCPVNTGTDQLFWHECDTYQGMSGGSNYDYNKSEDVRTVYAVIVAGNDELKKNISFTLDKNYLCWVKGNAGYEC